MQPTVLFYLMCASQLLNSDFTAAKTDYCKKELQCNDTLDDGKTYKLSINSACNCRSNPDPKRCGEGASVTKFSDNPEYASYVLQLHNEKRELIASGKEKRGFNEGATDMLAMVYDKQIEYLAWCYSHKCNRSHDDCRKTEKFDSVGQNQHFEAADDLTSCAKWVIKNAVEAWYEEIKYLLSRTCITENDDTKRKNGTVIGHYTQLVWATTTHIGCAFMYCKKLDDINYPACNIFCNYGPAGNWLETKVYTLGAAGSACEKRHEKYKSLCLGDDPGDDIGAAGAVSAATTPRSSVLISSFRLILFWY